MAYRDTDVEMQRDHVAENPGHSSSIRAQITRFADRLGLEQRGIERVPEDQRFDIGLRALLDVATFVRGLISVCPKRLTRVASGVRRIW